MIKKSFKTILLLLFLLLTIQMTVYARAGGGGGGGSGGGSGGGGSSYVSSGRRTSSGSRGSGNIVFLVQAAVIFLASSGGVYLLRARAIRSSLVSKEMMREIESLEGGWNYHLVQSQVKEAYYAIQDCWGEMNADLAGEYLSEGLREEFQMKLDWMRLRKEEPVQRHVKLICAYPVSVHDEFGEEHDYIWYYIEGRMTDYTIHSETREIIKGTTKSERFVEYWKFVKRNRRWVLDQILQKDDVELEDLK